MKLRLFAFGVATLLSVCSLAGADWKDDVGYNALAARLGGSPPTGAGISVTQIEAPLGVTYRPDETLPEFSGKTPFTQDCPSCNTGISSHATTVGVFYYGNTTGIAPGITTIGINEANNWISNFLKAGVNQSPVTESRRIQSDSWIGSYGNNDQDNEVDRRLDLLLQRDGVVTTVGANNGAATAMPQLLGSAYNVITVGLTSGNSSYGPVVSGMDGAGRVKPDIVAPDPSFTSFATPRVASAAALLLQVEDNLNILSSLPSPRVGKAVLTKALLMAGATKTEFASFGGWRKGFAVSSTNGTVPLDYRFGAGELNIDNSHRILTANPQQTAGGSALATPTGWNYVTINTAATHQYFFEVPSGSFISSLTCLLTWNRHVTRSGSTLTATVANLDLRLFEATGFTTGTQRDLSVSTIDNVEHIWLQNLTAGRYVFEVTATSIPSPATSWEYAIAWDARTAPATLPPDLDHDGDVDMNDVTLLAACRTGPNAGPPGAACTTADFDADNDVDQADFGVLQRCFVGPGVIPDPTCYQPAL